VLPNSEHGPASFGKSPVRVPVSDTVAIELLRPPCGVRLGFLGVFWAAMPEATVHEDDNPATGKHDVCAASEAGKDRLVHPVAQPKRKESLSQGDLRRSVSGALALQPRTDGR
jgi:hypothetical protein